MNYEAKHTGKVGDLTTIIKSNFSSIEDKFPICETKVEFIGHALMLCDYAWANWFAS